MALSLNHFSFLHIILFVYPLVTVTCTRLLLSHDEECSALYKFKQSFFLQKYATFGTHWFQKFESWKITSNTSDKGSDCCLWDGVVCSKKEDESFVIGVDLSESFLRGPLNSTNTLFNLVHLQMLNLSMNDFTGSQIPSRIAHLKQLRILDLSDSGFTGQIPNEISQLIQLSSLDLSGNPLKLQSPTLDTLVQNLTRLEELHLSGVDISSSVPHLLANFSSLRSIKLRNCLIRNEFPTSILQLPKLKYLSVAFNTELTGSFPEFQNNSLLEHLDLASTGFSGIVPQSIRNLKHLAFLRISRCFFSGNIPSSFSNMTQLTALGIADNEFTGPVPSLVSLVELNTLELSGNQFKTDNLPDWLGKLTKLEELYLYEMNLHDRVPPFLANLTKLSVIAMAKNYLFGHVPSVIFNLTQLTTINLGDNQLQGSISSSFSNFKSLQGLSLQGNNFSGRVDLNMFLGLNQLETLLVGGNRISILGTKNYTNGTLPKLKNLDLSSCNLKEYPPFLRFQPEMIALFLNDNQIDGLIPEWSWNVSQETLEMIDLSNNFITGFHQHQPFLPWTHLTVFSIEYNKLQGGLPIPPQTTVVYDVSNNHLNGEIPPLICELHSLQLLDLSSNNMSGTLPPCFGSLSNSLVVLDLHNNSFQGTMMNSFMQGSLLKRIDLSKNHFVGQVSKSLTNCTSLEVLSLGDNSFEDVFPSWLGVLAELQVLILRSNKFYGVVQGLTTVSLPFPMLRIIDLSNNGFSGQLPHVYFQNWNAMKSTYVGQLSYMESKMSLGPYQTMIPYSMTITYKGVKTEYPKILKILTAIDLSCNKFEGEIPQSLQDLHGLESLNLSNNHLVGNVLPSLGNLKKLESFDLSQNKLSGEIPNQLLQLGFLAIFNVSFNHLDGRIPQGEQFNTFESDSYMGNAGLCGKPLSKECQFSKPSTPPSTSEKSNSLLPRERIDWIIIFFGFGCGMVIGIVIGNLLFTRKCDRFFVRFLMRKDRSIRPLRNRRRN